MATGPSDEEEELVPRDPTLLDLVALCRELNCRGCAYLVVGGFAIRASGYARHTSDVDLVIATDRENEAKVFDALATLPDGCVRELDPGDVEKYTVVRVADEILVDLMASASGICYEEAARSVNDVEVEGVLIPFANPDLLWRMKCRTHREKDRGDLEFLRQLFAAEGRQPPGG